jgi:HEAT repeat protein
VTAAKVVVFVIAGAAAGYAATVAPRYVGAPHVPVQEDSLRPGPDSTRIATLLDALGSGDRLVCDMFADQVGNFWSNDDGLGVFSDRAGSSQPAKDSLHGRVRQPKAIALLTSKLSTENACVRRVAAKLLGRSVVTTDRLVALMDDPSPRVREAAAYAIGEGDRGHAHAALESKLGSRDTSLAAMSAWALAEVHDSASVPALLGAIKSPVARVRMGVIQALGELKNEGTAEAIEHAAGDSHAGVRHAAVDALGEFGLERSVTVLSTALSDADARVRYAAASALGDIHDLRKAPDALIRAASSSDVRLAEQAVHSLAEIKDPATVDVMIGVLSHPNRELRLNAVQALGEMRSKKAVPGLIRALKDSDPEVRKAAAEALGELKEG